MSETGSEHSGVSSERPAKDFDDMTIGERFRDPSRRIELVATILMSVAVVCSAYCAWQATRWGGVQATAFAEASSMRLESSKAMSTGVQQTAYDASTLLQLAVFAYSEGGTRTVTEFSERFMREEFKPFVDEWLAFEPFKNPEAPKTPFELEDFKNAEIESARGLEEKASASFEEAKAANQTGDDYILATVYFATVLFFAGVSTKLDERVLVWAILVLATAGLGFGFSRMLTLPFH